jgi:hypothetical protein
MIGGAIALVAAVVVGLLVVRTTQASYSCTIEWEPAPTASPAAGATNRLGYAQDDMGNVHNVERPQRYTFCPPASGNHFNQSGLGPITPRVYGVNDNVGPPNWVHNLEHGGLVILYRSDGDGATEAGQDALRRFFETFPPAPICNTPPRTIGPVIARFDDMKWPFAALVWDRVLPMDTWDPALALQFFNTEVVRLDADGQYILPREPAAAGCPAPSTPASPSPSASASAAPSASGSAPSAAPSAAGSAAPSASPASS